MRTYRALLRLYPRAFREDYGVDLDLLLRQQLRDEPALRVWCRLLLDLTLTVPAQHLEARMSRRPSVPALYAGVAAASLGIALLALVVGGPSVVPLLAAVGFGLLAVVAARRSRPLAGEVPAATGWWKYLVGGAAGLALALLAVAGREELAAGPWLLFAVAVVASLGLLATGVVLLVVRTRQPHAGRAH